MSFQGDSPLKNISRSSKKLPRQPSFDSGAESKIADITDKFKRIQSANEGEKRSKHSKIENALSRLEKEISHNTEHESKIREFKDSICNLKDIISAQAQERDALEARITKSLNSCIETIKLSSSTKSDVLNCRLSKAYTERASNFSQRIKSTFDSLSSKFEDRLEPISSTLDSQVEGISSYISELQSSLQTEDIAKEEGIQLLTSKIDKETSSLTRQIAQENKFREEAHYKLEMLISDTFTNIKLEIRDQSSERKENSDSILRLLEDTCNKLDRKISGY